VLVVSSLNVMILLAIGAIVSAQGGYKNRLLPGQS